MDKSGKITKQNGFFDLGISLILLAIFGTTVAVVDVTRDTSESQQVACADLTEGQAQTGTECY